MIYMSSFFKWKDIDDQCEVFSGAVYQPKGYTLPKCDFADIRDERGNWIRPRNFLDAADPAAAYYEAMRTHFGKRAVDIYQWCLLHPNACICCWCPYDRAAKRQLAEFGSFICHTGPLASVLLDMGYEVVLDKDRDRMYNVTTGANKEE